MNNFTINSMSMAADGMLVADISYTPVQPLNYITVDVMITRKTRVFSWRFETGEPEFIGKSIVYPDGFRDGAPRGWYCSVYPEDDDLFIGWMSHNCPTANVIHRFNSGDPMWTVHITDEMEATLFTLRWS